VQNALRRRLSLGIFPDGGLDLDRALLFVVGWKNQALGQKQQTVQWMKMDEQQV
jgi:hypothetical protein